MAVTVVTNPNALNPVSNGVKWKLNISDTGTHPIYKQALFNLQDGSGNDISALSVGRPIGGGDIPLDFRDDIKGRVRAIMPQFGVNGVQNDTTIMKEFRIRFGERIIDVTVPGSISDSFSNSSNYKVISASNNVFDSSLITSETERLLSYRPKRYSLFPDSYDWIWLLGSGTVTYKLYNSNGVLQSTTPVSASNPVNAIPMNLNSIGASLTTSYMEVRIQAGAIDETYTIDFDSECEGDKDNAVEILFIEPLGGRSVALFQTLQTVGATIDQNTALIYKNINNVTDLRSLGGDTIIYKNTYGTFSMVRQMSGDPKEIDWVIGFMASGEYHIRRKDTAGAEFWAKFIVDSGSFQLNDKTFSASGRLAMPIKGTIQP